MLAGPALRSMRKNGGRQLAKMMKLKMILYLNPFKTTILMKKKAYEHLSLT